MEKNEHESLADILEESARAMFALVRANTVVNACLK